MQRAMMSAQVMASNGSTQPQQRAFAFCVVSQLPCRHLITGLVREDCEADESSTGGAEVRVGTWVAGWELCGAAVEVILGVDVADVLAFILPDATAAARVACPMSVHKYPSLAPINSIQQSSRIKRSIISRFLFSFAASFISKVLRCEYLYAVTHSFELLKHFRGIPLTASQ